MDVRRTIRPERADQRIALDGPPARTLPLWGRRVEFEDFLVELVPPGRREFNVKLERTFASINFGSTAGTSSLAGDRLRRYDRRPFEFIIAPPKFPLRGASEDAPEVLAFVIDFPRLHEEIASAMDVNPDVLRPEVVLGSPEPFATGLAKRIRKQLLSDEPPQQYLEALCVSLIVEMFRPIATRRPKAAATPVDQASLSMLLGYIDENLDGDLSIGALADLVGATRDQLTRAFSTYAGHPPHGYIMDKRVDRAREMVCEGCTPLAEIAAAVGFSSQSHMTTTFKQRLGRTPGDLRRATQPQTTDTTQHAGV